MTIKELANIFVELIGQHGDMPVITTWDDHNIEVNASNVYVSKNNELVIDVESNGTSTLVAQLILFNKQK